MNMVTVIGSTDMDTALRLTKMPEPRETIHTHEIFHTGGGRDTNQTVAAERSGARTSFTGGVGTDSEKQRLLDLLTKESIDTSRIAGIEGAATGQTMIMVDTAGENNILIHTGANSAFHEQEVRKNRELTTGSDFIIAQFESNLDTTILTSSIAKDIGKTMTLNPVPTRETIPTELLERTDIITSNETGTEIITGTRVTDHGSLVAVAGKMHELSIGTIIIALGSTGAFYCTEKEQGIVPAFKVGAIDMTATDDIFIGTLSSTLQPDLGNLKEAILYGNLASSIAVQSYGTQLSIPYREALEQSVAIN